MKRMRAAKLSRAVTPGSLDGSPALLEEGRPAATVYSRYDSDLLSATLLLMHDSDLHISSPRPSATASPAPLPLLPLPTPLLPRRYYTLQPEEEKLVDAVLRRKDDDDAVNPFDIQLLLFETSEPGRPASAGAVDLLVRGCSRQAGCSHQAVARQAGIRGGGGHAGTWL